MSKPKENKVEKPKSTTLASTLNSEQRRLDPSFIMRVSPPHGPGEDQIIPEKDPPKRKRKNIKPGLKKAKSTKANVKLEGTPQIAGISGSGAGKKKKKGRGKGKEKIKGKTKVRRVVDE